MSVTDRQTDIGPLSGYTSAFIAYYRIHCQHYSIIFPFKRRIFLYHRRHIPLRQAVVTSIDCPSEMVARYALVFCCCCVELFIARTDTRHATDQPSQPK